MSNYYSSKYKTHNTDRIKNRSVTLADEANVILGNNCTWVIGTQTGSHNLDVLPFDPTNFAEFNNDERKPVVVIKCIGDASVNNVVVRTSDGAGGMTTLYTFAADYSGTPRYLALRISATAGADGKFLWEVA